jgi:hypothetical protein
VECNVPVAEATQDETALPEDVQEALGQLLGAAKEGLLALSVEVGLGVLRELLEEDVEQIVGPKGRWNRERTAVRHGRTSYPVRSAPLERCSETRISPVSSTLILTGNPVFSRTRRGAA